SAPCSAPRGSSATCWPATLSCSRPWPTSTGWPPPGGPPGSAPPPRRAPARGRAELVASATAIVARHAEVPAAWDGLRRFKRRELVRVAVRDLTGDLPVERVGTELSALAQACLEAGLGVGMREAGPGTAPGVGAGLAQREARRGPHPPRGPGGAFLPRAGRRGRPGGRQPGRRPGGPGAASGPVGRH